MAKKTPFAIPHRDNKSLFAPEKDLGGRVVLLSDSILRSVPALMLSEPLQALK